jgi:RND family efflux transporter MFP subunit
MLESREMIETQPARGAAPPRTPSGFTRALKLIVIVILLAVLAGALVVWGIDARIKTAAAVKEETLDLAIPTVSVIRPKPGTMQNNLVLPGNIQAFIDSPIYARASGYLKKWYVDIGMKVKAGQVLAEIDAPELDQQVRQATAAVAQAQAALEQALANQQQAKANVQIARLTAERWRSLAGSGVVSRQENDQYQAQYLGAVSNLQALGKAVAAARSNIASAQADVARLQELQAYKTVRAPFDGVITARNTDIGALINAGAGTPSQELFHIASTSKLRVFVNVPQMYSRSAVPGLAADLTLPEFPGRRFRGMLARTSDALDTGTRTLLAEVDVDNATGELKPGSYAEVHLTLPVSAQSLILPVGAIIFRSQGLQVGVIRDGNKVELIPITLGKDYGTEVEVVSGLNASDQVIMNPPDSLTSGTVVRIAPGPEGL